MDAYVADLPNVVDIDIIRKAGHPDRGRPARRRQRRLLGRDRGAAQPQPVRGQPAGRRDVAVHDARPRRQDPDGLQLAGRDGSLIANRDHYQIATGNDADSDRHGIVTPDGGPDEPKPLPGGRRSTTCTRNRPSWPAGIAVGKTAVSSSIIDRVVDGIGRKLVEVPVGFKWFVDGLIGGTIGFGGEESAGASFLRRDGSVWTTDKDGIILALLASRDAGRRPARPRRSGTSS